MLERPGNVSVSAVGTLVAPCGGMWVLLNDTSPREKGVENMSPRPVRFLAAASLIVAAPALAAAQSGTTPTNVSSTQLGSARIVEWDLPQDADFNPGAIVVDTRGEDNNAVWFVTRLGGQKVYRFNVQSSLMKNGGQARWTSWDLVPGVNMGGIKKLRPSHDRRFAVVRTSSSIQEVDTQACAAGTPLNPATC